ncbi:hypothetical protein SEA_RIKSENGUPTA_6 [Microbacterium phage RikSengupta]|nr:hypothetical protein SEA_RIKSENGUPTA_6 [Microbacterium phage RikSengupta]
MRSFTWKRWSGTAGRIDGVTDVEFGAAHVVFYNKGRIVRAVRVENVNELTEVVA